MIVEELLTLPGWVDFEGINFEMQLFKNHSNEIRLCYPISYVNDGTLHKPYYDETGQWLNRLADPENLPSQGWLYLQEGIDSDATLVWAIRQCWYWMQERGLLIAVNGRPYG